MDTMAVLIGKLLTGSLVPGLGFKEFSEDEAGTRIPRQLRTETATRLEKFDYFIADMVDIMVSIPDNANTAQEAVWDDKDRMYPFRELAPSRVRSRGPEGPYTENSIRSKSGLFSALVWRGVTFGTLFSQQSTMLFRDGLDFKRAMKSAGVKDDKYFCDPKAYGMYMRGRKVELADQYWDMLQDGKWEKLLKNHDILPYKVCVEWLKGFPMIGNLIAHLISSDLTYAGVVDQPTCEDIALTIRNINSGGAHGLQLLGLIPTRGQDGKTKTGLEDCIKGLNTLRAHMESSISENVRRCIRFDWIMIEHGLCKFSKVCKRNIVVV